MRLRESISARPLAWSLMSFGFLACGYFVFAASQRVLDVEQWQQAQPMRVDIDLSQPGEVVAPFHQTCSESCNQLFVLELPQKITSESEPHVLLGGMSAEVLIQDSSGKQVFSTPLEAKWARSRDGVLLLSSFNPFATGEYRATVKIDSGATALTGVPQTFVSRYELCGLELFPALAWGAFAFVAGLIGLVAFTFVLDTKSSTPSPNVPSTARSEARTG